LLPPPAATPENVRNAIVQRLGGLRHAVHTLTADNGKEFADHRLIAACLQSDFYFADPYCPWQRGSNENANGLTRLKSGNQGHAPVTSWSIFHHF
ncbi:transposase, partial [Xanthomonas oryzae pv. oryzae]